MNEVGVKKSRSCATHERSKCTGDDRCGESHVTHGLRECKARFSEGSMAVPCFSACTHLEDSRTVRKTAVEEAVRLAEAAS